MKEKEEDDPVDASSVEEPVAGAEASCSEEDEGVITGNTVSCWLEGSGALDSGSIREFGQ